MYDDIQGKLLPESWYRVNEEISICQLKFSSESEGLSSPFFDFQQGTVYNTRVSQRKNGVVRLH